MPPSEVAAATENDSSHAACRAEIARLHKIIDALIGRAERATSVGQSDFGLFQTAILLDGQVRQRTAELEAALRENERITRSLRESEERYRSLASQSLVAIALLEVGRVSYVNPKFESMFGYPASEIVGQDLALVISESGQAGSVAERQHRVGRRRDGTTIDVECHCSHFNMNGTPAHMMLMIDVTERVRAEREVQALQRQLEEQAIRDPLTGLYNRRFLDRALGAELHKAIQAGVPLSIIMADLDRFKAVNDTYGHPVGDTVLQAFGELLRRNVRPHDICCRFGGEEFLLVFPGMDVDLACERARALCNNLSAAPLRLHGLSLQITASFGVATCPRHASTADALIDAADRALYRAKQAGRNRVERADH